MQLHNSCAVPGIPKDLLLHHQEFPNLVLTMVRIHTPCAYLVTRQIHTSYVHISLMRRVHFRYRERHSTMNSSHVCAM